MQQFRAILIVGVLVFAGCSISRNAEVYHPWGWNDAADAKSHLDSYRYALIARVDECSWEDRGPHRLTPYHYKATVVRSYKGDWRPLEKISFVHFVDAPAPAASTTNALGDNLVFVFLNEHTNAEIGLDPGEWGRFGDELAPALEEIYPERSRL